MQPIETDPVARGPGRDRSGHGPEASNWCPWAGPVV